MEANVKLVKKSFVTHLVLGSLLQCVYGTCSYFSDDEKIYLSVAFYFHKYRNYPFVLSSPVLCLSWPEALSPFSAIDLRFDLVVSINSNIITMMWLNHVIMHHEPTKNDLGLSRFRQTCPLCFWMWPAACILNWTLYLNSHISWLLHLMMTLNNIPLCRQTIRLSVILSLFLQMDQTVGLVTLKVSANSMIESFLIRLRFFMNISKCKLNTEK